MAPGVEITVDSEYIIYLFVSGRQPVPRKESGKDGVSLPALSCQEIDL